MLRNMTVLLLGLLAGCSGDSAAPLPPAPEVVASLRVLPASKSLTVGDSTLITFERLNATGAVIERATAAAWSSSNSAVATVNDGKVRAMSAGSAMITVTADARSATAAITVTQPVNPADSVAAVLAITASATAICGVTSAGLLYCAGPGFGATPRVVAPALRFKWVGGFGSADGSGFCAIASDDAAYCWGTNRFGQLGVGDTLPRLEPTAVAGGLKFSKLSTGDLITCGVSLTAEAYCWGAGTSGAIGDGQMVDRLVPTRVKLDLPVKQISTGNFSGGAAARPNGYTCALSTDGKLYCWGGNGTGQLGDGKVPVGDPMPHAIATDVTFAILPDRLANFTCASSTAGALYCWGNAIPLGGGPFECPQADGGLWPCLPVPTVIASAFRFTQLNGYTHTGICGITDNKQVACIGRDESGRFGQPEPECEGGCSTPKLSLTGFQSVSGSVATTCGIALNERPYCWGSNSTGAIEPSSPGANILTPTLFKIPVSP